MSSHIYIRRILCKIIFEYIYIKLIFHQYSTMLTLQCQFKCEKKNKKNNELVILSRQRNGILTKYMVFFFFCFLLLFLNIYGIVLWI
jgi:hypothetical protein